MTCRVVVGWCAVLAACGGDPYGVESKGDVKAKPAVARAAAKPEFVPGAASGEIASEIATRVEAAEAQGTMVVVYVGADWCEPCQRFHDALERGELDQPLAGVRFVEYDADRDGKRLTAAGYDGRLIPRFAVPGDDGRFGGVKIEGGTKGDGAVAQIMTRLGPMLEHARR